jgi:CelD/BcsL family acetyltransferase involved in cellulose biosynthesis
LDIQVVNNKEEFAALRDDWNELLSRSSTKHIFLTHEWQYTWWEHFGARDEDLLILLVRNAGRLVGIAPLRRDVLRVRGVPLLKVITFLVGYEADYRDFLLDDEQRWKVLAAIIEYLRGDVAFWQVLRLSGVHGDSSVNGMLPVISRQKGLHYHGNVGASCPFIPVTETYDAFLAGMSRETRRKYQQKLRKMEREEEAVELEVRQDGAATRSDIEDFLKLHALSWQKRGGSSAVYSRRIEGFHLGLMDRMQRTAWPTVSRLVVNGRLSAIIYGFAYDGVFYDYLPGADPALERYSLGAQALMKTVAYSEQAGWREIDLMRGDEDYKFHFTRQVRHTVDHQIAISAGVLKIVRLLEALST